jgi:dTDP-4-dehydrorhamnose reductase
VRFLVVGASGLIGGAVVEFLRPSGHSVLGTYNNHAAQGLTKLDIRDRRETIKIAMDFCPDIIVDATAMADVDRCEKERNLCYIVNVLGTSHLIDAAKATRAKLVFFSSDYIFDGESGPYSEDASPHPINFYGACKMEAENRILGTLKDFIIIRTTVVYGWEVQGKNFVVRLIETLKRGERTEVPLDQVGSPTYASNIPEALLNLISKGEMGIFNVVGPELMDRYTFARLTAEIFDLPKKLVIPTTTAALGKAAARPLHAGLKIDKLSSVTQVRMLNPEEGLRRMRASKRNPT